MVLQGEENMISFLFLAHPLKICLFNNVHSILEVHAQKFSQQDATEKNLSKPQWHNAKIYSVRALSYGAGDISQY